MPAESRWKLMEFECDVPGCAHGYREPDHADRNPATVPERRCPDHRDRPLVFVRETPLFEGLPTVDGEQRVYALPLDDLAHDWVPIGAVVAVRAIDGNGRRRMTVRYVGDFMAWEGLAAAKMIEDDSLDAVRETAGALKRGSVDGG